MRVVILILGLCFLPTTLSARPLTEGEFAKLDASLTSFANATMESDWEHAFKWLPARVLTNIADQADVDIDQLRETMANAIAKEFAAVKLMDFEYDITEFDATDAELEGRIPVVYGLFATSFTIEVDGTRTELTRNYLAISENENWSFLRVQSPQQIAIMRAVYPFMGELEFDHGTTRMITE